MGKWWENVRKVYDYRRWPLFSSYASMLQRFGFDVMNYHSLLWQFVVLYAVIFLGSLGISLCYLVADYDQLMPLHFNMIPLVDNVPYSYVRGHIWTMVLVLVVFWGRYVGYQRQTFCAQGAGAEKVQDVSIVLMNIPNLLIDEQICYFVSQNSQQQIVKYLRIGAPQTIRLRKQMYKTQKGYEETIREMDQDLRNVSHLRLHRLLKNTRLLYFFQILGYHRDEAFYWARIQSLQQKIQAAQNKSLVDAAIISFASQQSAETALGFVNSHKMNNNVQFHAIKAPAPNDIFLENLVYNRTQTVLRYCLTFFIVFVASFVMFCAVSFLRYRMRVNAEHQRRFIEEEKTYYGFLLLTLVADGVLRPVLYWAQSFERHYSLSHREAFWILKLFVYQVLNKFGIMYSRTVMHLDEDIKSFFDIFGYTTQWRTQFNQGGTDLKFFMWIVVFGYNAGEFIAFLGFQVGLGTIAKTRRDQIRALKSYPQRYASKYVFMLVVLTLVLCFGHVMPFITLQAILYFPLQSLVSRFTLLRVSETPLKSRVLVQTFENYVYVAALLGAGSLGQSYRQLDAGPRQLIASLFFVGGAIVFCKSKLLDGVLRELDRRMTMARCRAPSAVEEHAVDLLSTEDYYEIAKPAVTEQELSVLSTSLKSKGRPLVASSFLSAE